MSIKLKNTIPSDLLQIIDKFFCNFNQLKYNRAFQGKFSHITQQLNSLTSESFYLALLSSVDEWQIQEFVKGDQRQCPQILSKISTINFINIKILDIKCQQITNLQCLTWVNAPNLTKIVLSQNDISSLKSLNKMNTKKLTFLSLDHNPRKNDQFTYLNRMNTLNLKILSVYLLYDKIQSQKQNEKYKNLISDRNIFFKLQGVKLLNSVYGGVNIKRKVQLIFKQKFKFMNSITIENQTFRLMF